MAWETRRGRLYYYRKERQGKRVVSKYMGTGVLGQLAAELVAEDRLTALADRADRGRYREDWKQSIAVLDAYWTEVEGCVAMVFTACGYHRHNRGRWRKKRGQVQL